jgi:hypothetical protein
MITKIVAFAGRKQSGKTTCSEFVVKYLNGLVESRNCCKIYNFADPLKQDICMGILGLTYDQCYGEDEYKNTLTSIKWKDMPEYNISWTYHTDYDASGFMTARQVMQKIGTNIFRQIKHDVWSSATINKIKKDRPNVAVIADCRFPNEVEAVRDAGGIVIKLTRNPYNSDHESEVALDEANYSTNNFDLIIYNDNINIQQQNQIILEFLKKKKVL